ncbi:hypothetical protein VCHENC02_0979B, partial [Vibrio harveyi]
IWALTDRQSALVPLDDYMPYRLLWYYCTAAHIRQSHERTLFDEASWLQVAAFLPHEHAFPITNH